MTDYKKIFNSLSIPCMLLEPVEGEFVIKDVTSGYCEIVGRKKEDLIGAVIPGVFVQDPTTVEDNSQIFIDLLRKTKESGNTHCLGALPYAIQNPITGKLEKRFWTVENTPVLNEDGSEVNYILHTIIDKTSEVLAKQKKPVLNEFSTSCSNSFPSTNIFSEDIKEKLLREKEKDILKREENYKKLIQAAFDLVAVVDKEGSFMYVSEASKKILGVPAEQYVGKCAFESIHPDDKERVLSVFETIDQQETNSISSYRYADAEGNYRWFETHMRNMLADQNIEGIVLNTREVTDLVKKNNEIEELNERYRLAATASGDLVYEWNLETNDVERFFKEDEKYFGYRKKDLEKVTQWGENIHPDEIEDLKKLLKNTLKNPQRNQIRSQYRFQRADGTYAHVIDRAQIIRNNEGEAIRLVGATIDISSIIERRNALKIANKRFSYAMKATQEMIWDWDIMNNTIERSKAFEKIMGPIPEDLPSPDISWYELVSRKDQKRVKESLNKALANPEVTKWREEFTIYQHDGKKAYVVDRAFIIRNNEGKAVRMVGGTLDVTESRRMMKAIEAQNKVLKEIAWEQAHIVRAPVARIKGLLDFINDPMNGEVDQKEILKLIKESTYELDEIVTNIVRRTEDVES